MSTYIVRRQFHIPPCSRKSPVLRPQRSHIPINFLGKYARIVALVMVKDRNRNGGRISRHFEGLPPGAALAVGAGFPGTVLHVLVRLARERRAEDTWEDHGEEWFECGETSG